MSELALYRKYRSTSFSEVIGQDKVVSTLVAALESGRISHAYLFSGPRGVGKTTVARLLAKSLNCTGTPKPCGKCANCLETLSANLDIIEIDGASNRGIDEIRELRDKIALAPTHGQYKAYIIDEVHMLTEPAFNALLKTLEEPPAHAVFILATTEAHKLPETIISRTQHFQFSPFAPAELINQLKRIAEAENIEINDEALGIIANLSRGGSRDAISLLDQVASSGIRPIDQATIYQLLGLGDETLIANLLYTIIKRQPQATLIALDALSVAGTTAGQITQQLIELVRRQLPIALSGSEESLARPGRLVEIINGLLPVARSSWPEVALEATVITLSLPRPVAQPSNQNSISQPQAQTIKAAQPDKIVPEKSEVKMETPAKALDTEDEQWLKTLAKIKAQNNSLYALLRSSCAVSLAADKLTLICRFNFHRNRLDEAKNRQIIERSLDQVFGRKIRVVSQLEAMPAPPKEEGGELVSSALEILGGEVVYE